METVAQIQCIIIATYDYTNYGKTMGAAIDTEGTSLGIYLRSQISQKINIEFSTKSVVH